jgi:hypothetical protein
MAQRQVTVAAVAEFGYLGRHIEVGDRVLMDPLEAAAAHRRGLVSLTRPARGDRPAAPPPPAPETKRRYRRRDLQPEP